MPDLVHLSAAGVSVVVAPDGLGAPVLLHWGAALGDSLDSFTQVRRPGISMSAFDHRRQTPLVPLSADGFTGTPGVQGHRLDTPSALPRPDSWDWHAHESGLAVHGTDPAADLSITVEMLLTDAGLLRQRTAVTNVGPGRWSLTQVLNAWPVGAQADELLDLTGRWCKERSPQRHPWVQGTHRRDGRHGRTGHDASLLMVAGTRGFGFGAGEVWGVHTAWSGDHTTYAERTAEGECLLGGGELLSPGELVLAEGETYWSPWLLGSYSGNGLDPMSHRLHAWLRENSPRTRSPRPVVINTWEAVYMDHDLDKLTRLADKGAKVGAERFVLDDGWFLGRRNDLAGLGDWVVDPSVWPGGLHPLVDHVTGLGMQFGLWVEPEMVNVDSEVARAHPGWILQGGHGLPEEWRHQQVLDLQHPDAYAHVRDQLLAILSEYDISYLKWDMNRDLTDASHQGSPAVHGQTLAAYRLVEEVRAAYPQLEIESCASGGARVDAEILRRTDRIWASDTIDALERQIIQRWTSLLVPPEMLGSHVGGPTAHTTGRSHRLGFRAATALLYHFGIEWDVSSIDSLQRHALGSWVELHKRIQPHIPSGLLVHPDHPDPAVMVTGLIAADGSLGWYVVATLGATATQHPAPLRLSGLAEGARYELREVSPTQDQHGIDLAPWAVAEGVQVSGRVLAVTGVALPVLPPDVARVIEVRRV